jgi:hypothetical protein
MVCAEHFVARSSSHKSVSPVKAKQTINDSLFVLDFFVLVEQRAAR